MKISQFTISQVSDGIQRLVDPRFPNEVTFLLEGSKDRPGLIMSTMGNIISTGGIYSGSSLVEPDLSVLYIKAYTQRILNRAIKAFTTGIVQIEPALQNAGSLAPIGYSFEPESEPTAPYAGSPMAEAVAELLSVIDRTVSMAGDNTVYTPNHNGVLLALSTIFENTPLYRFSDTNFPHVPADTTVITQQQVFAVYGWLRMIDPEWSLAAAVHHIAFLPIMDHFGNPARHWMSHATPMYTGNDRNNPGSKNW